MMRGKRVKILAYNRRIGRISDVVTVMWKIRKIVYDRSAIQMYVSDTYYLCI